MLNFTPCKSHKHFIALIIAIIVAFSSGCTVHRLEIQQGNIIKQDMLDQLKTGISKRQVRFVMGSPLLVDPFHKNRWDYVFMLQPGTKRIITEYSHVSLFFEGDTLVKIGKITL